jgi:cleavage and polyadenylation specificity factor subunit 3
MANLSPTERLERLFMFLEAQFGSDALTPIPEPKTVPGMASHDSDSENGSSDSEMDVEKQQQAELERLHRLGIPVPGIEIKVDKMVAKVWLEDLEVECANRVFGDRVRIILERAVEVVAPLWS